MTPLEEKYKYSLSDPEVNEWTPITERLPKKGMRHVLVTNGYYTAIGIQDYRGVKDLFKDEWPWRLDGMIFMPPITCPNGVGEVDITAHLSPPTHWMTLPAPIKFEFGELVPVDKFTDEIEGITYAENQDALTRPYEP